MTRVWAPTRRRPGTIIAVLAAAAPGVSLASAQQGFSRAVPGIEAQEELSTAASSLQSTFSGGLRVLSGLWRSNHNGLKRWLESLEVHIPMQSKTTQDFTFTLDGGLCTDIDLDHILAQETEGEGLRTAFSGVSITCTLSWAVTNRILPALDSKGTVVAKVVNASVGGTVALIPDQEPIPFPQGLNFSECQANISVGDVHFSGGVLSDIAELLLRNLIELAVSRGLQTVICDEGFAAATTLGSQALEMANGAFRRFMATESVTPREPDLLPSPTSDFADFQSNPGTKLLDQLVNGAFGNHTSPWSLNALVGELLGPEGRFSVTEAGLLPVSFPMQVADLGSLNTTVEALVVEGLDSWTNLEFKQPGPRQLGLGLGMDHLRVVTTIRLDVAPNTTGPLSGDTLSVTFDIDLGLGGFNTSASGFMAINTTSLGDKAFSQLSQPGCILESAQQILLMQSGFVLGPLEPKLVPRAGLLEHELDYMINLVVGYTLAAVQSAISSGLNHGVSVILRDFVNNSTEKLLGNPTYCPAPTNNLSMPPSVAETGKWLFISLACAALLCIVVFGLKSKRTEARTLQVPTSSICLAFVASGASSNSASSPVASDTRLAAPSSEGTPSHHGPWDCLAFHPQTVPAVRYSLPCCIVATMFLFLWANASVGTSLMLSLKANGRDVVNLPPAKAFTLGGTVKDMLDAGVYPLAFLIAFFSGCWPYLKLLMMLACWFCPTKLLSVSTRQKILDFLDAFGKWSLIDMFVMVMFMVAFEYNLTTTGNPNKAVEDLFDYLGATASFEIYVQPFIGFHTFILATLSSLCLGHITTSCHRKALKIFEFAPAVAADSGRLTRLCSVMRPPGPRGRLFTYVPSVILLATQVLVIVGIFMDTFAFQFEGLSGLLLGEEGRTRALSVFNLAIQMPYSNPAPNSLAIRWIQVTFIIFTMLVPAVYPLVLNCLWSLPLTAKVQRQLFTACQIMNAWAALDCFVVAILAGVLEIEQFALSIVGHKCDLINAALARSPALVERMHGKAACFDVQTELRTGFWLLLSSAVLAYVSNMLILSKCSTALCSTRTGSGVTRRDELECLDT